MILSQVRICSCGYCTNDSDDMHNHILGRHNSIETSFTPCQSSCSECPFSEEPTEEEKEQADEWEVDSMLQCQDCMRDRDMCPDCCDGDLYRSPDDYNEGDR
jgi:hypothetical protein